MFRAAISTERKKKPMATFIRLLDPAGLTYEVEPHRRTWRDDAGHPSNVTTEALVVMSSVGSTGVFEVLGGITPYDAFVKGLAEYGIPNPSVELMSQLPSWFSTMVLKKAPASKVLELEGMDDEDDEILALLQVWAKRFPEGVWSYE